MSSMRFGCCWGLAAALVLAVPAQALSAAAAGPPSGSVAASALEENPAPDQVGRRDSSSGSEAGGVSGNPAGAPEAQPARAAAELESLERAWSAPARRLDERVSRTRAAADELGLGSLDPLARALLLGAGDGTPLERASGAVVLAPDLPAAHWALARASWESGAGVGSAFASGWNAVAALPQHLESSLWLGATASVLLYAALLAAGLFFIAGRGLAALPHAAHDLADRIEPTMPGAARVASIAVAVLLPTALGEGLFGAALGLFGLAMLYADAAERRALGIAAALAVVALHPVAHLAGQQLAALGSDPVAESTWAAESGFVDPVALARLERADRSDPLAMHALALRARRAGDLTQADARYAALVAAEPSDPIILNNAANVRLALGDTSGAIELYRRATAEQTSALVWFNLSQAHGRAIQVDEHERALAAAQAIDPAAVSELTRRLSNANASLTAEFPLPIDRVRARLARADGGPAAAELRRPVAPGLLGGAPWLPPFGFTLLAALALAIAPRFERSRACAECGNRLCRRCGHPGGSHGLCAGCSRRRLDAHRGGPWESGRAEPQGALGAHAARAARVAGRLLPGVVGRAPSRPAVALGALTAAAMAGAAWIGRHGIVSDPASVGGAGPLAFGCAAALLLVVYAALAAAAGAGGRR